MSLSWDVIHALPGEAQSAEDFAARVQKVVSGLRCGSCKSHAQQYLKTHKPAGNTPKDWYVWTHEFHEAVNKRTGKPAYPLKIPAQFLNKEQTTSKAPPKPPRSSKEILKDRIGKVPFKKPAAVPITPHSVADFLKQPDVKKSASAWTKAFWTTYATK